MCLEGFLVCFLHEKQNNNQASVSCYLNAASKVHATLVSMQRSIEICNQLQNKAKAEGLFYISNHM